MSIDCGSKGISGASKWWSRLLDFLYPPVCGVCEAFLDHGRAVCDDCDANLPRLLKPFCDICARPFDGMIDSAFRCPNCRARKLHFDFASSALRYDDRTMGLIHHLKYRHKIHLAADLGRLAAEAFDDPRFERPLAQKWPLIPVPLHRTRLTKRHFNQAAEIALALSRTTGLPMIPALARLHATETQTRLTRSQRLKNLRGAFDLTREGARLATSRPPGAIVVDDVLTTGATVDECARVLRRAGVQKVIVVTVMRR